MFSLLSIFKPLFMKERREWWPKGFRVVIHTYSGSRIRCVRWLGKMPYVKYLGYTEFLGEGGKITSGEFARKWIDPNA